MVCPATLSPMSAGEERRRPDRRVAEPSETGRGLDHVVVRAADLRRRCRYESPVPGSRRASASSGRGRSRRGGGARAAPGEGSSRTRRRCRGCAGTRPSRRDASCRASRRALLRLMLTAMPDISGCGPPPMNRLVSPRPVSTLITSAPRSPRSCVRVRAHDDAGEIEHSNAVERSRRVRHRANRSFPATAGWGDERPVDPRRRPSSSG